MGKPLVVGLAIVATVCGVLVYALANLVWIANTRWTRRRRLSRRAAGTQVTGAGSKLP